MGRPRIHTDNAAKQKAYRDRLKQKRQGLAPAQLPAAPVTKSEGKPTTLQEFLKS